MIVELAGHRAAGKSTLADALARELRRRALPVTRHDYYDGGHPRVPRGLPLRIVARRPSAAKLYIGAELGRSDLNRLLLRDLFTSSIARRSGIHLVEEATAHVLPHVTSRWGTGAVADVLKHLHRPELVVVVTGDASETVRRVAKRRKPSDRALSPDDILRERRRVVANKQILTELTDVIEVRSPFGPEEVGSLAQAVARCYGRSAARTEPVRAVR